jgi:hypothetical protein
MRAGLHQCPDQAQKLPMLGAMASSTEKLSDFDTTCLAPRWSIGLMHDEHLLCTGIADQIPSIAVWAAIKLSRLK